MPGLTRRLTRSLGRRLRLVATGRDRGAVSALVAVLLGGGVLLGMGAVVVDAGQIYAERAQIQNGADAAALAVAQGCAVSAAKCDVSTGTGATAATYAGRNANDGTTGVTLVCGSTGYAGVAACPGSTGRLIDCPAAPATGTRYVDIHTATLTSGGSTLLPPVFARALAGNAGFDGTNVKACARASWGSPRGAATAAFTMSYCEWTAATSGGTSYAAPPPYPPNPVPPASADRTIQLHGTGSACAGSPSGWDLPGGFGWLADTTGSCGITVDATLTYADNTGASAGNTCKTLLQTARTNRTQLFVPVYDGYQGNGNNGTYHLKGFAAFVVTGYNLPGLSSASWLTGTAYCKGSAKCVYGYFTRALLPPSALGTVNADLGGISVSLSG
jgi:Flp pilus assembly protein TadG